MSNYNKYKIVTYEKENKIIFICILLILFIKTLAFYSYDEK